MHISPLVRHLEVLLYAEGQRQEEGGMPISPSPLRAPQHVLDLLARLHKESAEQEAKVDVAEIKAIGFDAYMEDKFIALDEDKCLFTYQLLRAINAQNVVEVGSTAQF